MVIDPISRVIFNKIDKQVKEEVEQEEIKNYRIKCPKCRKSVIKEQLIKNGCFVCGFKPEG